MHVKQHSHYWDDAEELLRLARAYDSRIKEHGKGPDEQYFLFWMRRLCRMSFIVRMMAVESLVNNCIHQFGIEANCQFISELGQQFDQRRHFPRAKNLKDLKSISKSVSLNWKVFLLPYLCTANTELNADRYFDYSNEYYETFRELIRIRNDFVHPIKKIQRIQIRHPAEVEWVNGKPITGLIDDSDLSNFYNRTGICKDPISFRIVDAERAAEILLWIRNKLDEFLMGRILDRAFWIDDKIEFDS